MGIIKKIAEKMLFAMIAWQPLRRLNPEKNAKPKRMSAAPPA